MCTTAVLTQNQTVLTAFSLILHTIITVQSEPTGQNGKENGKKCSDENMYMYRLPKKQLLTQLCYEVVQHIHCPVRGLIYHRITVCILETFLRAINNNNNDRLTAFDPGQPG